MISFESFEFYILLVFVFIISIVIVSFGDNYETD